MDWNRVGLLIRNKALFFWIGCCEGNGLGVTGSSMVGLDR